MSRYIVAREWLIAVGCILASFAVTEMASFIWQGHAWDLFGKYGLFSRYPWAAWESRKYLLLPLGAVELVRFTVWCAKTVLEKRRSR